MYGFPANDKEIRVCYYICMKFILAVVVLFIIVGGIYMALSAPAPKDSPSFGSLVMPTLPSTAATGTNFLPEFPELPEPEQSEGVVVGIKDSVFDPAEINIRRGETVTWSNNDLDVHAIVSEDGLLEGAALEQGDIFELTFPQPGEYVYHCKFHPEMRGKIIVE